MTLEYNENAEPRMLAIPIYAETAAAPELRVLPDGGFDLPNLTGLTRQDAEALWRT